MKISIHAIITASFILLAMGILWMMGMTVFDGQVVNATPWAGIYYNSGIEASPDQFDLLIYNFGVLSMVLVWITWFHRTYSKLRKQGKDVKMSPWLASFGWFIPFANLVIVPMAVRDAWRLSVPGDKKGGLVWLWWLAWFAGGPAISFIILNRWDAFYDSGWGVYPEAMGLMDAISVGNVGQVALLALGPYGGMLLKAISLLVFGPWLYIVFTLDRHTNEGLLSDAK